MSAPMKSEREVSKSAEASRRQFLRRIAVAGAGTAGLALLGEKPARADVHPLNTDLWTHGNSAQVEAPQFTSSIWHAGFYTRVSQNAGGNWIHFAIPTLVYGLNNDPVYLSGVAIEFLTPSVDILVPKIDIYDGGNLLLHKEFQPGLWGDHSTRDNCPVLAVSNRLQVYHGVGISVNVTFSKPGWIQFYGAGARFYTLAD